MNELNKKYDGTFTIVFDIPQQPIIPFRCSDYKDLKWTSEWENFNLQTIINCPIGGFTGFVES